MVYNVDQDKKNLLKSLFLSDQLKSLFLSIFQFKKKNYIYYFYAIFVKLFLNKKRKKYLFPTVLNSSINFYFDMLKNIVRNNSLIYC